MASETILLAPTGLFDRSNLYVVDLGNLSSDLLLEQVARAWYTPTGHVVYVRPDGAVFAVPFDPGALAITGGAVPLLNGVRFTGATADMRLGADGTLLYVEGSAIAGPATRQLLIADLDGNEEALPLAPWTIQSVGWSPDGQSVVYASGGQIYTYNVALGTTPRQLTFEGVNRDPVFSPNGSSVAFSLTREGTDGVDLFVTDLNDDSPPRSIITLNVDQRVTQWPSDTLIVFERCQAGVRDLCGACQRQ